MHTGHRCVLATSATLLTMETRRQKIRQGRSPNEPTTYDRCRQRYQWECLTPYLTKDANLQYKTKKMVAHVAPQPKLDFLTLVQPCFCFLFLKLQPTIKINNVPYTFTLGHVIIVSHNVNWLILMYKQNEQLYTGLIIMYNKEGWCEPLVTSHQHNLGTAQENLSPGSRTFKLLWPEYNKANQRPGLSQCVV